MGKHYDIEFKNTILNEYLSGKGGSKYLGKKYKIFLYIKKGDNMK